jgi:NitT/TauT family transport system substrate-binding protein
MATLTPLSKSLIAVAVLAAAGAASWHLVLKDRFGKAGSEPASTSAKPGAKTAASGPLGGAQNPLKVSIVSFHGYAPALVANGSSLKTQPGSIYDREGVNVEFVIQDDIPTLTTIFESGTAQCAWRTSDFWAQEQPNLRNSGHDGRAVMIVDNTQGGDAIISRDASIRRVEDLAGKKVALLQFTPSDGMTIDALENASMTARQKDSVKFVYIQAEEGTGGVRAAFEAGSVDAAVLWDPDLSLALKKVPGSKVVYSTKAATNLIYDVMVCDQRVLADANNQKTIQAFVSGWMKGVEVARADHDQAVKALVDTEEFFSLLAKDQGVPFIKGLFENVVWTGIEDNARILGLAGGTNHYDRVYRRFDAIYRNAGALANPKSPVINPQESFDYRFIRALYDNNAAAQQAAAKPEFKFTEQGREQAATRAAVVTKPVMVGFATGSAALNKRSDQTIDQQMVPFIENNGGAYFEVSGNTDATGAQATNQRLSELRAQAVVDYLAAQWDIPRERFRAVGNGSSKPICNESNPAAENLSLEECRALNRTTRVAVLQR